MPLITFGPNSQSRNIPVPVGRSFTFAANGTYSAGTDISIEWYDGLNWIPYVIEFQNFIDPVATILINYGSINEIRMNVSGSDASTNFRIIVNVVPIERALM
jgi:hypothetical protein